MGKVLRVSRLTKVFGVINNRAMSRWLRNGTITLQGKVNDEAISSEELRPSVYSRR